MTASRLLSVRLTAETLEQLEAQSRQTGQPISRVVKTLLDEGLRMQQHPGIVFRSGPAGRRPGLAHGPDVWEVARVFREVRGQGGDAVQRTAELTGLTRNQIDTVVRYYAAYQKDIDAWIRRVDEEAERAEAAWRREQQMRGA
jgi:hypothetical protein